MEKVYKEMHDLTTIYYTSNTVPERFRIATQSKLLEAVGDVPIISVSQKPIDLGLNICVGDIGRSSYNIYKQILMGVKEAKTEYVATAEDDVLYSKEHFAYRPRENVFAYDTAKWSIYSWIKPPVFTYKENRKTMTSLIVRKDDLARTLEERLNRYPDPENYPKHIWGEPGRYEGNLGIGEVKIEMYSAPVPSIVFNTEDSLQFSGLGTRKRLSSIRATEIPYWGRAADIIKYYES